jgi:diguanylate cyclase (GGDEF)-like protein
MISAILAGLLAVALGLLADQWLSGARVRAERDRLAQEQRQIADLANTVGAGDWPRSVRELTGFLVRSGVCRAAALLAVGETGSLEHRASAHDTDEAGWTSTPEAGAHRAVESGDAVEVGPDLLFLPVQEDGEAIGVLALQGAHSGSAVLPMATRLAALGLTGMRNSQRHTVLSNTDGLTGLSNHRHFQQALSVALAQSYLENEPLSLILMDIDHFKAVNDSYGHLLGDLVLRELAYLLRRELPAEAVASRYGGEEFAVVLRGADARRAEELAEQVRKAIADRRVFDFSSGTRLSVTVSLGVAHYELGQGKSRLIARADEALYASKRSGRDRVTVALPENDTSHLFPT